MTKPVILAEKPSQAKAYADAFSIENKNKNYTTIKPDKTFTDGAIITWAVGHLVELKPPQAYDDKYKSWNLENLPIMPNPFEYQVSEGKKEQFDTIKSLMNDADEIIIATDIDREGEAIARLIMQHANIQNKNVKRLWVNSLEKDEIQKGMVNLKDASKTYDFFIEAQSRQQADWLVGMNLSPLFTLPLQKQNYKGSLSIGRVQSPTVYLIYQRQKEIENFKSETFYEIEGHFNAENGQYTGKANVKEYDKAKVQNMLHDYQIQDENQGTISSIKTKEKTQKAPRLHSLSTLQKQANKRWKYSPKKVLDIVQKLYDKKVLSYPRTDSNHITENEFEYLVDNISDYQQVLNVSFEPDTTPKKRYVDSKQVEEHYAIIPTRTIPDMKDLTEEERNIYYEVMATTLSMFHDDYIYDETTIMTDINGLEFKTAGKTEKNKGWKNLFPQKSKQEQQPDDDQKQDNNKKLPDVHEGDSVTGYIGIKEGQTKPPKPYTEGQLINAMKTIGKVIEDEEEEDILKNTEGIGTEATRSGIIEQIKQKGYIKVKNNTVYVTKKGEILCQSIEGTLLASPSMTAKWESFLSKIGKGQASQEQFLNKIQQFIDKMIDEIPETLSNKQVITDTIQEQKQENAIAACPKCSGQIVDKGKFYGCDGYKDGCKFTLPKKLAGKNLTKTMIKTLAEKGKTNELKGFKSKKGNEFKAALVLNNDYKIEFEFF